MNILLRVLAFVSIMLGWWALVSFAWELGAAAVGAGFGWMFLDMANRVEDAKAEETRMRIITSRKDGTE